MSLSQALQVGAALRFSWQANSCGGSELVGSVGEEWGADTRKRMKGWYSELLDVSTDVSRFSLSRKQIKTALAITELKI
jgi:hypothetical protein